jgi:hypothetical protein
MMIEIIEENIMTKEGEKKIEGHKYNREEKILRRKMINEDETREVKHILYALPTC